MRCKSHTASPLSGLAILLLSPAAQADDGDLWQDTIGPKVREGTRLNFEGRFDAADAIWSQLQDAYPDHPAGALFAVETLFWRQLYDLFDRGLDGTVEDKGREAMRLARDWFDAHPESARAALFVGQAEIQLGRLDGLLERYYAAGRHAERGQEYLELALELDPALTEARYWLGLYRYYASTLQDVLQLFSWLWFIPEPDGPGGLRVLHDVRESESALQQPAELALMNIYTYYETDYAKAASIARSLHAKFPRNTLIHFELLRILHNDGDYDAVIDEAKRLEAHPGTDPKDRGRAAMARVWRARATFDKGDARRASTILRGVDMHNEALPTWGPAWIHLLRGRIAASEGDLDGALSHLERAVEMRDDSPHASRHARNAIAELRRAARDP